MVDASYRLRDAIMSREANRAAEQAYYFSQPLNTYYFRQLAPQSCTLSQLDMVPNFPAIRQLDAIVGLAPFNTLQSITQLLEVRNKPLLRRLAIILDHYLYTIPLATIIQEALALPEVEDMIMETIKGTSPRITSQALNNLRRGDYLINSNFLPRMLTLVTNSRLLATWFRTLYGGGQSLGGAATSMPGYASQESLDKALLLAPEDPLLFQQLYNSLILTQVDIKVMVLESLLGHNSVMLTALVLPRIRLLALVNSYRAVDSISKLDLLMVSQAWRPYLDSLNLPLTNINNTWQQLINYKSLPGVRDQLLSRFKAYVADDLDLTPDFSLDFIVREISINSRYRDYFSHTIPRQRLIQLVDEASISY